MVVVPPRWKGTLLVNQMLEVTPHLCRCHSPEMIWGRSGMEIWSTNDHR